MVKLLDGITGHRGPTGSFGSVKLCFLSGVLPFFLVVSTLLSGCEFPGSSTRRSGEANASSTSSLTRRAFNSPTEIFRLSIKAIRDKDIEKFMEYHIPEIRDKIEEKAFEKQTSFFRTHSPVVEIIGERIDGDTAFIDFVIKVGAEGKVFSESDSTRLQRHYGEWKISSF